MQACMCQINSWCFVMDIGFIERRFRTRLHCLPVSLANRWISCVAKTQRFTETLLFSLITPASHCTSNNNSDTRQVMLCCLSKESSQMWAVSHVVPRCSDRSTVFTQNNKAQCCLCAKIKPALGLSLWEGSQYSEGCWKASPHKEMYLVFPHKWLGMHTFPEKPKGNFNPRFLAEAMLPLTWDSVKYE